MIDTKELRRLAQEATSGPWINHGRQPNVAGLPHSAVAAKTLLARVYSEAYGDVEQETANASFIAAANPAAISELLDRIDAAERDVALTEKVIDALDSELNAVAKERDELRAKTAEMEKQEPAAWFYVSYGEWDCYSRERPQEGAYDAGSLMALYALPGAKGE